MVNASTDLIRDFVNTLDLRPYTETLDSPAALAEWLTGSGLLEPGTEATTGDLEEAKRVREALRDLLSAQNELHVDVERAGFEIDEGICRADLALRFVECEMRLVPGVGGVRGAIGKILAAVSEAMADGTWGRMKACRAEDCRWVFVDTAKNRSRAWCSMQTCGNRAKAAAYRERHLH